MSRLSYRRNVGALKSTFRITPSHPYTCNEVLKEEQHAVLFKRASSSKVFLLRFNNCNLHLFSKKPHYFIQMHRQLTLKLPKKQSTGQLAIDWGLISPPTRDSFYHRKGAISKCRRQFPRESSAHCKAGGCISEEQLRVFMPTAIWLVVSHSQGECSKMGFPNWGCQPRFETRADGNHFSRPTIFKMTCGGEFDFVECLLKSGSWMSFVLKGCTGWHFNLENGRAVLWVWIWQEMSHWSNSEFSATCPIPSYFIHIFCLFHVLFSSQSKIVLGLKIVITSWLHQRVVVLKRNNKNNKNNTARQDIHTNSNISDYITHLKDKQKLTKRHFPTVILNSPERERDGWNPDHHSALSERKTLKLFYCQSKTA